MIGSETNVTGSETTQGRTRDVDLVFEGGGLKGIALVGAYSVLEEHGYTPQNMAGASAGAIVAALVAAGYTAAELRGILASFDFETFKDAGHRDRLPLVSKTMNILRGCGMYQGRAFLDWMTGLLEARGVKTFGDLVRRPEAEPRYRHRLQVIASDLTEHRLLVLPMDAHKLGVQDPDELDVALAVRMSMSIPVYFEPVSFFEAGTGREHLIVDGGMLSNFPVWLFDSRKPLWPTIGMKFVAKDPRTALGSSHPRGGLFRVVDYARSLAETLMEAHDRFYLEETDFHRTIAIDPLGVRSTDFDLTREEAVELYASGRAAAEKFLRSGWKASEATGVPAGETHLYATP